jgi:hypothetical protein
LSGVATVTSQAENIYNQTLSQSQSAPQFHSQSWKHDEQQHQQQQQTEGERTQENASNAAERAAANELKKKWHNALRMCKAQDAEKTGFIKREIFVASLENYLSQV